jgi:hypothetical protein
MNRRWPAIGVLVLGELVILGHAYVSTMADAMPFAPTYRSTYAEPVTIAALAVLGAIWAHTRNADRDRLRRWLGGLAIGLATALAAYVPYHRAHAPLFVPDGFRGDLQQVTPFHEQLAAPVFLALGFAVAIVVVARLTTRAAPGPALRT